MERFVFLVVLFCPFTAVVSYKAAVLEYYPSSSDTPKNTILTNLEQYRQYTDSARQQSTDIIVFPEYGLTKIVTDPTEYAIEITTDDGIIQELSNMALERQMYLVVNLLEKARDNNNNTKYYNTNLVFARNGSIIAKYRKINLFDEPNLTPGDANQRVTFKTDFGVTFGIFTCFDIVFDNPASTVLTNNDVTDIVYPSAWISIMPFFTSLSVQHGYAIANGLNLLAANYGEPKNSHGGSGIYLADGTIANNYIDGSPSSKLIVSNITLRSRRVDKTVCPTITPYALPGSLGNTNITNYVTKRDFDASKYTLTRVPLDQGNFSTTVCHKKFCCTFDIIFDKDSVSSSDHFKVMAFDGQNSYNIHTRVCTLLACESDSDDSCGARVNTTTKFTKITVKGNLAKEEGTFYMPLTLNYNLKTITQTVFCDTNNATNGTFVQMTTTAAQGNVLVFGLLGRSSAGHIYAFFFLVVLGVVKCFLF